MPAASPNIQRPLLLIRKKTCDRAADVFAGKTAELRSVSQKIPDRIQTDARARSLPQNKYHRVDYSNMSSSGS